ncbi:hypothetical protein [Phaeobacter sp. S60]|uniref:hypothetical protein n=1 Tax=Phaeobacter sp. S60 TaxID=1569353 RepID=UPI000AFCF9AB|nr:hypothetical protein [Phaeobacter sp. S60]
MTTMAEIINRAYRKTGVVALDDEATGDEAAVGIEALNGMLHEWKLRSVDIEHTDAGLSDVFSLGPEYHDGVVYMLATRLSPDFVVPPFFDADDFFRAIQAAYMTIDTVSFERGLTEVPSKVARRNSSSILDG